MPHAGATRRQIIGEAGAWADKNVVADLDPVPHHRLIFYRDPIADPRPGFDERVAANVTVAADYGSFHHMRKGPDPRARTDLFALANRAGVNEDSDRCHVSAERRLHRDNDAVARYAFGRRFHQSYHPPSTDAVGTGLLPRNNAVEELIDFAEQRFFGLNDRDYRSAVYDQCLVLQERSGDLRKRRQADMLVVQPDRLTQVEVVAHRHLPASDDRHLPDLVRIEPAGVNMRGNTAVKDESREYHVVNSGIEIALTLRRHRDRGSRHEVAHDRSIVGRQVPQRTDIGPHRSEVGALEAHVVDFAQLTRLDQVVDDANGRIVFEYMADHQHAAPLLGQSNQIRRLPRICRQRLLDQRVLAGFEHLPAQRIMCSRRGRDDNSDDGRIGDRDLNVSSRLGMRVAAGEDIQVLGVHVAQPVQHTLPRSLDRIGKVWAPISGADESGAKHRYRPRGMAIADPSASTHLSAPFGPSSG